MDVVNYDVIVISLAFDECVETIRHLLVEENGYVHILVSIYILNIRLADNTFCKFSKAC